MKKIAKSLIVSILGWQVKRLLEKNDVKVIAVVGSIGKTSTKFAIARVLSESMRVRFQEGNYNDTVTVPLVFFGHQLPPLLNILAWLRVLAGNESQIRKSYPYDIVVVEVGTDGPDQIKLFESYLRCDFAVVTAITAEHMEYFPDLDAVAREELSIATMSETIIANADLCDERYLKSVDKPLFTYGKANATHYRLADIKFGASAASFSLTSKKLALQASMAAVSVAELYSASAAAIIAHMLGLADNDIAIGISQLQPVAGRMQRLRGIKNSLIIDETYNASPVAVKSALDSIYALPAPQKIAILGNMNELGHMSEQAHREIGAYCEPNQLDWVVTIGPDANKFTAPEAEKNGCRVASFDNPYAAGEFVRNRMKAGALILAKGSQNGVYAEEAVKLLLKDSADEKRLVRQSSIWLKKKQRNFSAKA